MDFGKPSYLQDGITPLAKMKTHPRLTRTALDLSHPGVEAFGWQEKNLIHLLHGPWVDIGFPLKSSHNLSKVKM
jgi:hypothetical protein